jgi:type II secretory pathway pseudopilin PulG
MRSRGISLLEILIASLVVGVVGLSAAQLLSGFLRNGQETQAANQAALDARQTGSRLQAWLEEQTLAYFSRGHFQGFEVWFMPGKGYTSLRDPQLSTYGSWEGDRHTLVRSTRPPQPGIYLLISQTGQSSLLPIERSLPQGNQYRLEHPSCPKPAGFASDRVFALHRLAVELGQNLGLEPGTLYFRQDQQDWIPLAHSVRNLQIHYVYRNAAGQPVHNPDPTQGYIPGYPANFVSKDGVEYQLSHLEWTVTSQQTNNQRSYRSFLQPHFHANYRVRQLENCQAAPPQAGPGRLQVQLTPPVDSRDRSYPVNLQVEGPSLAQAFGSSKLFENLLPGQYTLEVPEVRIGRPVSQVFRPVVWPGPEVMVQAEQTTAVSIRYTRSTMAQLSILVRGLPSPLKAQAHLDWLETSSPEPYSLEESWSGSLPLGSYTLQAREVIAPGGGVPYLPRILRVDSRGQEQLLQQTTYGLPAQHTFPLEADTHSQYILEYQRSAGRLEVELRIPPALQGKVLAQISGPAGVTTPYTLNQTFGASQVFPSVLPGQYYLVAPAQRINGQLYTAQITPGSSVLLQQGETRRILIDYNCTGNECLSVPVTLEVTGGSIGSLYLKNASTLAENSSKDQVTACPPRMGQFNCQPGAFALDNTHSLQHHGPIESLARWAGLGIRSSGVRLTQTGPLSCWRWDALQGTRIDPEHRPQDVHIAYGLPWLSRQINNQQLYAGSMGRVAAFSPESAALQRAHQMGSYGWNSQAGEQVTVRLALTEVSYCYDTTRDQVDSVLKTLRLKCPSFSGPATVAYGLTTREYQQLLQQYQSQLASCTVTLYIRGQDAQCVGQYWDPDRQVWVAVAGPPSRYPSTTAPNTDCILDSGQNGQGIAGLLSLINTGPNCSFTVPAIPHYDRYRTQTSFDFWHWETPVICQNKALP